MILQLIFAFEFLHNCQDTCCLSNVVMTRNTYIGVCCVSRVVIAMKFITGKCCISCDGMEMIEVHFKSRALNLVVLWQ